MAQISHLLVLSFTVQIISVVSDENKYFYNAAVVGLNSELTNVSFFAPTDKFLSVVTQTYKEIVEEAYNQAEKDLDIIVFPESSLKRLNEWDYSTFVPDPHTECICDTKSPKYRPFLIEMSCLAKRFNTTLVINFIEKYNCTKDEEFRNCPKSGIVHHNTNVAFNETGYVSARYRKWNLYGEILLRQPPKPEPVTFTTKKGYVFGLFTCFDIMFEHPSMDLIRNGVKNIVFQTKWFPELPFLTPLQVQQMWAYENNVTFLAAGYNNPGRNWGTGIYLGDKGPAHIQLNYGYEPLLAVRKVPINGIPNNPYRTDDYDSIPDDYDSHLSSFTTLVDPNVRRFRSKVMRTDTADISEEVCYGDTETFCCQFKISISTSKDDEEDEKQSRYTYHLMAFSGKRSDRGVMNLGYELCGVIACLNSSVESCGQRYKNASDVYWDITFNKIEVSATFPNGKNRAQYPNSLQSNLSPITPLNTTWTREDLNKTTVKRSFILNSPVKKLLTFGIFGRIYTADEPPTSGGSSLLFFPTNSYYWNFVWCPCLLYVFNLLILKTV